MLTHSLLRVHSANSALGLSLIMMADTVDGLINAFTGERCYMTDECCWAVYDFDLEGQATEAGRNRIESMMM